MPRLDLIILPLLAGYIFLFTFNLTKFYNIRVDRQRLIFNSLLCTVFISFFSFLFDFYILKSESFFGYNNPLLECRTYLSTIIYQIIGNKNLTFGFMHLILIFISFYPLYIILF